jgi:TolA-binding protein
MIRTQLESFPHDFRGQMLLAEMQAEDLNDMPSAQVTIQRLCQQKGHSPGAISAALMQLADWQLKHWQDRDAARESLEKIIALFPDTEFAHVAEQRISHLASNTRLIAAHDRPKIQLRAGLDDVGLHKDQAAMVAPVEDIAAKAAEYVKHLDQHPRDAEAREQLAIIYAEHYQRLDYALGELEQIIQQPGQSPKQIVRVLNLMADLQLKCSGDYEAARQTLQRIVDKYPNLGAAEAAQRRLAHLRLELRSKEKAHVVQLGTYEQDLGLKKKLSPKEGT